jgi:hypothetical protein
MSVTYCNVLFFTVKSCYPPFPPFNPPVWWTISCLQPPPYLEAVSSSRDLKTHCAVMTGTHLTCSSIMWTIIRVFRIVDCLSVASHSMGTVLLERQTTNSVSSSQTIVRWLIKFAVFHSMSKSGAWIVAHVYIVHWKWIVIRDQIRRQNNSEWHWVPESKESAKCIQRWLND